MYEIKTNTKDSKYSIILGRDVLKIINQKIKKVCSETNKVALIIDINVPKKFITQIKKNIKNYKIVTFKISPSEKIKSLATANKIVEKLLTNNFNRSDLIIGIGGGIIGDISAFAASITKRGINFFNIPTTLLSQVDSSIGGKTGVNTKYGKNLIGSFYQPKLVIIDVAFLKSLSRREMICGFGEILKHAIIRDKKFFKWLKKNTQGIFNKEYDKLIYSIHKSCKIKLSVVNKDLNEKNLRMILNFGHTFAHAIEAKNKFSNRLNHGEAVLIGIIMATRLSCAKKICSINTLNEIMKIYDENSLNYNIKKYFQKRELKKLLNYMSNDKKNNDDKINFILLNSIGKPTKPGNYKIKLTELKRLLLKII